MTSIMSRRAILTVPLIALPALVAARRADDAAAELGKLEESSGGRLGVAVLDTGTGKRIEHRADERFAMCSTFKFLAAAAVLSRVDRGEEKLDRRVSYSKADLVANSPITERHVGDGMTVAEICHAAITASDNTAGNLMLATLGGPAGLTAYARSLGDEITQLDRIETALNEATPGDPRDTTTPAAMLGNLHKIVLGDALSEASRAEIKAWLLANKTGGKRLRAGMSEGWQVGDKTGAGDHGATNDIGIVWPPDRAPIIISAYTAESSLAAAERDGVLKQIGRIVTSAL